MLISPNDTDWMYCVDVVDGVLPLLELFLLAFVCLFELEGLDQPDLGLGVVLRDDGACNLGESIDNLCFSRLLLQDLPLNRW